MIIIKDNFLENVDKIRIDALNRYSTENTISAKNYPGIKIYVPENIKKNIEKKAQNILNENVTKPFERRGLNLDLTCEYKYCLTHGLNSLNLLVASSMS